MTIHSNELRTPFLGDIDLAKLGDPVPQWSYELFVNAIPLTCNAEIVVGARDIRITNMLTTTSPTANLEGKFLTLRAYHGTKNEESTKYTDYVYELKKLKTVQTKLNGTLPDAVFLTYVYAYKFSRVRHSK